MHRRRSVWGRSVFEADTAIYLISRLIGAWREIWNIGRRNNTNCLIKPTVDMGSNLCNINTACQCLILLMSLIYFGTSVNIIKLSLGSCYSKTLLRAANWVSWLNRFSPCIRIFVPFKKEMLGIFFFRSTVTGLVTHEGLTWLWNES